MLLHLKLIGLLLLFPVLSFAQQKEKFTISGIVQEKGSGELLPGVSIYLPQLKKGTTTNSYGFYSITLPRDTITIIFSYIGYAKQTKEILLNRNYNFDVELVHANDLKEVVVRGQSNTIADKPQMSTIDIPIKQIKDIPALLGEKDVFKVIQLLPGVQKGTEGQSGLYVRGGGPDQNLIILDDAPVYNAQHLFGFFSVFNGDALKSVELTKGGFPARYGGRLSSVIDMQMKDGNKQKYTGEFGIGAIASRGVFEGPIKKGKSSFLISARRTYFDILTQPFIFAASNGTTRTGYYFYDFNAKCNFELSKKDRLFISGYFGKDKLYLKFSDEFSNGNGGLDKTSENIDFHWGNGTGTVRWTHLINPKLFLNTSAIYSQYQFGIGVESKYNAESFKLSYFSGIYDLTLKSTLDYIPNPNHTVKTGALITRHLFTPSAFAIKSSEFPIDNIDKKKNIEAIEGGLFVEDIWKLTNKINLNPGLRFTSFTLVEGGKTYLNAEPRFSGNYIIIPRLSAKISWATMNQYIHLLSNTGVGLPTDLWVPATEKIIPQRSHQIAAGLAKDFYDQGFSLSLEGYYKALQNIITYKDGATFIQVADQLNGGNAEEVDWQNNITRGQGKSYGIEVFAQKKEGKFTGWVGYTLSWTKVQFAEVNFGKEYFPRHDRRHDISVVGIYEIKENMVISATWVYGTGNAITLPQSEFVGGSHIPGQSGVGSLANSMFNGLLITEYGGKNASRMAPYHRADIGFQMSKPKKRGTRMWELSCYNVYNRANPFFYYVGTKGYKGILGGNFSSNNEERELKQVSLFRIIPTLTYSYKFK